MENTAIETRAQVGHELLRLSDIDPKKSPAFSPNLFKWLQLRARHYRGGVIPHAVYRIKAGTPSSTRLMFEAGTLLIGLPADGHPGDTDFIGARLTAVLCQGSKETSWCYAGITPDIEVVDGFWDRYLQVGRCAIDPEHKEHFVGNDRYTVTGDTRACQWCGHKQQKLVTERIVKDESWVTIGEA